MDRLKMAVGSLAGVGYLPAGPGTWGSLFSLFLLYPAALLSGNAGLMTAALAGSLLTLWVADCCEKRWGTDPPRMVIDEFAGQALVFLFIPFTGAFIQDAAYLAAGFALFRFFDIVKPLAIKRLQHFPSGFGILFDDLLAGLYALTCLHIGIYFISVL
ncbi:MAG: phosphatidylglycerophosphatase A [Balneolaceae bacterium]